MELCMLDQAHLVNCEKRNTQLERAIFRHTLNASASLKLAIDDCEIATTNAKREHLREIKDLHRSCGLQVQKTFEECKLVTNLTGITTSIENFSHLLKKRSVNLKDCNSQKLKLSNEIIELRHQAKNNRTKLQRIHDRQAKGIRSELDAEKLISRRQITLNHGLLSNITRLEHHLETCEKRKHHYRSEMHKCDIAYFRHEQNITNLNNTLKVYKNLVSVLP